MSEHDHPIDDAVRRHLDAEAAKVDARAVLARVKAATAPAKPSGIRKAAAIWVSGALTGGAVAAAVLLSFFLTAPLPTARVATAAELVEQARETHAAPTDRCYDVVAEWNPDPLRKEKLEPIVQASRLWTRGDQFWISTKGQFGNKLEWGQDKAGKLWIALGPKRGLTYDPSEVGEPVQRYCDLMSLRVVSTLGDLLQGYDLKRRDGGKPGDPIRIEANLRPNPLNPNPKFGFVGLDLDPETKVIRKAVLNRQLNGEPVGTLTFTLAETGDLPDDQYEIRGHLDPDAVVLDGRFPPPGIGPAPRDPRDRDRAKFREDFLKKIHGTGPRPHWDGKKKE
jgi:hypothetical protein